MDLASEQYVTERDKTDPSGSGHAGRSQEQLADYLVAWGSLHFEPSTDIDERRRLKAISNAEVLRKLQLDAGYSDETSSFLGGGFAYDYLDTFEVLPEVRDGENVYPGS